MPTKIVRFAKVKDGVRRHAGYYPLPEIKPGDDVQFTTETLDVTLEFDQSLRVKFDGTPSGVSFKKGTPTTLKAKSAIVLEREFRLSNIHVQAKEYSGGKRINFMSYIDPCY